MKVAQLAKQILILVSFILSMTGVSAMAATGNAAADAALPAPKSAAPATAKGEKKTTDVSFEDVLVQGKYHFSDEAVTTVEEDKVLDSLLGVRKDFQDRIKKSVSRQ